VTSNRFALWPGRQCCLHGNPTRPDGPEQKVYKMSKYQYYRDPDLARGNRKQRLTTLQNEKAGARLHVVSVANLVAESEEEAA
jgi:hypothetical protein